MSTRGITALVDAIRVEFVPACGVTTLALDAVVMVADFADAGELSVRAATADDLSELSVAIMFYGL